LGRKLLTGSAVYVNPELFGGSGLFSRKIVSLDDVNPDNYFLHAKAFIRNENHFVEGDDSLIVLKRSRKNIYDVTIETH
jgi:hypothetical protein